MLGRTHLVAMWGLVRGLGSAVAARSETFSPVERQGSVALYHIRYRLKVLLLEYVIERVEAG